MDQLLRGSAPARSRPLGTWRTWAILLACACMYGTALGSLGGLHLRSLWQMVYSSIKLPMLLVITFWLTIPSFFILASLLGLRGDFTTAFKALAASQAVLTITLASLAPLTLLWYFSDPNYNDAIFFSAASFLIASLAAQGHLRRAYRPLIGRSKRHRVMLIVWLLTYGFVGIQMSWVLRPFIGDPSLPTTFFRSGAFTNAYLALYKLLLARNSVKP
jgi:hypothetical protein